MFKLGDKVCVVRSEWGDETADLNQEGIISAILEDDVYNYEVDFGCTIINNEGYCLTHTGISEEDGRKSHYRFYNKEQLISVIDSEDIDDFTADEINVLLS